MTSGLKCFLRMVLNCITGGYEQKKKIKSSIFTLTHSAFTNQSLEPKVSLSCVDVGHLMLISWASAELANSSI